MGSWSRTVAVIVWVLGVSIGVALLGSTTLLFPAVDLPNGGPGAIPGQKIVARVIAPSPPHQPARPAEQAPESTASPVKPATTVLAGAPAGTSAVAVAGAQVTPKSTPKPVVKARLVPAVAPARKPEKGEHEDDEGAHEGNDGAHEGNDGEHEDDEGAHEDDKGKHAGDKSAREDDEGEHSGEEGSRQSTGARGKIVRRHEARGVRKLGSTAREPAVPAGTRCNPGRATPLGVDSQVGRDRRTRPPLRIHGERTDGCSSLSV